MALKIKVSARSAAPSAPDRFRPIYATVPAPDSFVSAPVPVQESAPVPAPSAAVPDAVPDAVPVQESTPAPSAAGSVPVPCSASPESGSVTVRPWFHDFIVQVAVPGFSRPFYVSKYYRGRYSLTRDPLYAKTWSSPVLALEHAARVREKLVDYPYSFG